MGDTYTGREYVLHLVSTSSIPGEKCYIETINTDDSHLESYVNDAAAIQVGDNVTIESSPSYLDIRIDEEIWENIIQDTGCVESDPPFKRYKHAI